MRIKKRDSQVDAIRKWQIRLLWRERIRETHKNGGFIDARKKKGS